MVLKDNIVAANLRIKSSPNAVVTTPLEHSSYFSELTGTNLYFKCEHLQKTGSFKLRGATNKLSLLSKADKNKGVITASTGNHGQAVAYAASLLGINATVVVPDTASETKVSAILRYGARIQKVKGGCLDAEIEALAIAEKEQKIYVSPYNDEQVVCGQGTIGLELLTQLPELDAVFIAVGGGGLISGIGSYIKRVNPKISIIGCWPENSTAMYQSLNAGKVVKTTEHPTLSDGTAGEIEEDSITLPICQQVIDQKVLVTEQQIAATMQRVAAHERYMLEGAACVALSGAIQEASKFQGKNVAAVLCGRNITLPTFIKAVSQTNLR
ncbi:threonine/serine dehydratase [Spongorhabdus nitratireducens]